MDEIRTESVMQQLFLTSLYGSGDVWFTSRVMMKMTGRQGHGGSGIGPRVVTAAGVAGCSRCGCKGVGGLTVVHVWQLLHVGLVAHDKSCCWCAVRSVRFNVVPGR